MITDSEESDIQGELRQPPRFQEKGPAFSNYYYQFEASKFGMKIDLYSFDGLVEC